MAAQPTIAKALTKDLTKSFFEGIKTVLFDADGVLWEGSKAIPGSIEAFNKLISLNKRVIIVTNNSSKTLEEYREKCASLGFNVDADRIISSAFVTAWYLNKNGFSGKKVYLIGTPALATELDAVGVIHEGIGPESTTRSNIFDWARLDVTLNPDIEGVVVGFDPHFNLVKTTRAASYIMGRGLPFFATNEDQQLPLGGGVVFPGTGAIVAAVATAVERQPDAIMGKPHQHIFQCLQEAYGIDPATTVMIGDRLNTDILFAGNNGIRSILVLTGCSSLQDVVRKETSALQEDKKEIPTFYADSVAAIGEFLE